MNKHLHSVRDELENLTDELRDMVSHLAEDGASEIRRSIHGLISAGKRRRNRAVRRWLIRRYAGELVAVSLGAVTVAGLWLVWRDRK